MDSKSLVVTKTQYKLEISASVPRHYASTPREVTESTQHFDKNSSQKGWFTNNKNGVAPLDCASAETD